MAWWVWLYLSILILLYGGGAVADLIDLKDRATLFISLGLIQGAILVAFVILYVLPDLTMPVNFWLLLVYTLIHEPVSYVREFQEIKTEEGYTFTLSATLLACAVAIPAYIAGVSVWVRSVG